MWTWLKKTLGYPVVKVQVHQAKYVGLEDKRPFVFMNVVNAGKNRVFVTRLTVAETKFDEEIEINYFPAFGRRYPVAIQPGEVFEVPISIVDLGKTQIFDPSNFRVHLSTGEVFKGTIRESVGAVGYIPTLE